MLIEKNNTYVTINFTDKYISENYLKYAPLRVFWSVLNDEEKEQFLIASIHQIDKLRFVGRKLNIEQPLQFPRLRDAGTGFYPQGYPYISLSEDVPIEIKEAQIENALGIIYEQIKSISDRQFMTMQALGAVKNTKYNKREGGDLGFGAELQGAKANNELSSDKAYHLLRGYLGGLRC